MFLIGSVFMYFLFVVSLIAWKDSSLKLVVEH